MIQTVLSDTQVCELNSIRRKTDDPRNERVLSVLMSSDGMSPPDIAKQLKRHYNTIIDWLKRYQQGGITGLARDYSPGRPSERNAILRPLLEECLKLHPSDYGYPEEYWDTRLFQRLCQEKTGRFFSNDTIERALHDAGYVYKRPRKSVPDKAPSKAEKKAKVLSIINEIKQLLKKEETEILMLDESHFSTDPYVIRGWQKRGEPFFPKNIFEKGECYGIWSIQHQQVSFCLEKIR